MTPFRDPAVAAVFSSYPEKVRTRLLKLRELIFSVAQRTGDVGELTETLKWGQPAYLTLETRSGSTLRIDALKPSFAGYALYFHCQTGLVTGFRKKCGRTFRYEGNRALLFAVSDRPPLARIRECVAAALTYHLAKRRPRVSIGRLIP